MRTMRLCPGREDGPGPLRHNLDCGSGKSRPAPTPRRAPTAEPQAAGATGSGDQEVRPLPIDGVLDLHTFLPREIKQLVPDYIEACRRIGILRIRIIHGKGTGALRQTVHAILAHLPEVAAFGLADEAGGGWGATVVDLLPAGGDERADSEGN